MNGRGRFGEWGVRRIGAVWIVGIQWCNAAGAGFVAI
jgi:hypothetical protein